LTRKLAGGLGHVLLALALCSGCAKKAPAPRRTEPWLATPSQSARSAPSAPLGFRFTSESAISFSVPGRKAKPSGQVPLLEGQLRLDPGELSRSTASIDADLTKLTLTSGAALEGLEGAEPSSLTTQALQWLELGAAVPSEQKSAFGRAQFELVSLEGLSRSTLDLQATKPSELRVHATVIGTLLVHGFREPIRLPVVLELSPPNGGALRRVSIRSAAPLVMALGLHDIAARDAAGVRDPRAEKLAAEAVGKAAQIELRLVAEQVTSGSSN
jgi:hypothetical protein